jgi:hypothetical protein
MGPVGVVGDTGEECANWKYCAFRANGFAHGDDGAEKGVWARNCTDRLAMASCPARSSGGGRALVYPAEAASAAASSDRTLLADCCGDGKGEKSS